MKMAAVNARGHFAFAALTTVRNPNTIQWCLAPALTLSLRLYW
jgi:hypothetical protein